MENSNKKIKVPRRTTIRKVVIGVELQKEFIDIKSDLNSNLRKRYKRLHEALIKEVSNDMIGNVELTKTKVVEIVSDIEGGKNKEENTSKFLTKVFDYFKIDKIQVLPLENQSKVKRRTIFESHIGKEIEWLQNPILKELFIQTNSRIDNTKNNSRYHFSYNTGAFLAVCALNDKILSCLFSNKYVNENEYFEIGEKLEYESVCDYFKQGLNKEININLIIDTIYLLVDAYILDSAKYKGYGERGVIDELVALFYKKIWD